VPGTNPSLLTRSDVMATGRRAAISANVQPGTTVAVVGDGPVGLCGVLAASHRGAESGSVLQQCGLRGGPAPVRQFRPDLLNRVWNRQIDPGRVFDIELPLEEVANAYRVMDERRAITRIAS
jgi:threonine dehydrogenase-like Zn-dependent dehydrogenase